MPEHTRNRSWWNDPAWRSIPAALAVVEGQRVLARNPRCRRLLEKLLGSDEAVWDRWLVAAAVRLRIEGCERRTLAIEPQGNRRIELSVGEDPARIDRTILCLREIDGAAARAADLVGSISTLSHEFRTPLAAMKSSLGLLTSGETGLLNADQVRFLELTVRNIDRLDRLVHDLLDVARADAGRLPLHQREVDLTQILGDALVLHARQAREAGLELEALPLPAEFIARVDPDKILQMLANVVGNSIKYCEPGDRITVELRASDDNVAADRFELVVRDSGPGIAPDRQRAAFEPFCRAHDETGDRVVGAGLGLYITRGLVEAHGGEVELDSRPGAGTTVRLRLPRAGRPEAPEATEVPETVERGDEASVEEPVLCG